MQILFNKKVDINIKVRKYSNTLQKILAKDYN